MPTFNFDANTVPENEEFAEIPPGEYLAIVDGSELALTKRGDGELLKLKLVILEGAYENRMMWDNINYKNSNPTAELIAKERLASLCRAVGQPRLAATEQLHGTPLVIKVKARKDGTGTEIRSYHPRQQQKPSGFDAMPDYKQPQHPQQVSPSVETRSPQASRPQQAGGSSPAPAGRTPSMPWARN